ncbi:uncharacterized protein LOC132733337 [Ruditapes philippinarum]|uniref:uncharacterized protein LOC132733337 n=1 Tax=Ruditapes philippinarum TaxID=129788 RepID=UPI00295BF559|nr:uncharacterized protein LOC132733337 [Ruditapes philippinarum]
MDLLDFNTFYKISLFVVFFYFVKFVTCADKKWNRNFEFDGKVSPDGSIISVRSRIHCGKICLDDGGCVSFFYLPGFLCQLHDHVIISIDGLRDLEKSTYYVLYEGGEDTTTPADTTTHLVTSAPPVTITNAVTTAPPEITAPPIFTTTSSFDCPPDDSIYRTIILSDMQPFTYKVVKALKTQSGARTACEAEGAYLARIKTVPEMVMLLGLIHDCPGYLGSTDYYVDGRNTYFSDDDEGPWRFILGDYVPMSNDFWALTYPTDAEDKNCLRMSATLDFKGSTGGKKAKRSVEVMKDFLDDVKRGSSRKKTEREDGKC